MGLSYLMPESPFESFHREMVDLSTLRSSEAVRCPVEATPACRRPYPYFHLLWGAVRLMLFSRHSGAETGQAVCSCAAESFRVACESRQMSNHASEIRQRDRDHHF